MTSIKDFLADADAVLIGAGAGLSSAAGLAYSGPEFEREFADFIRRYKITDLYTSSFCDYGSEEARWAYWAKHVMMARILPPALPLYKKIFDAVKEKDYFVITTNVDGQFRKAGFDVERLFEVQGDYAFIQSKFGTDNKRFYAEDLFRRMYAEQQDCRIPSSLVPYYLNGEIALGDNSGEEMDINIRKDGNFVQDGEWYAQAERYETFVGKNRERRLLLLEFGVGFNTPTIIRFPFERMAATYPDTTLVRLNRDYPGTYQEGIKRFYSMREIVI